MPAGYNRRTAPKVKDGRVQRKNRHRPTGHDGYVLDREPPGRGHRHVVTKRDIQALIDIIPGWPRYSERLERIVLACRDDGADGSHWFHHRSETGAIHLHAWPEDLWIDLKVSYFDAHWRIFEAIGLSHDREEDFVACRHDFN